MELPLSMGCAGKVYWTDLIVLVERPHTGIFILNIPCQRTGSGRRKEIRATLKSFKLFGQEHNKGYSLGMMVVFKM